MNAQKLEELMIYLGQHPKVENLGSTKMWKLIYFIDAEAVRGFGESVTGSEFIKYEHGPVPSRGEKLLRKLVKREEMTSRQRTIGDKVLNEVKAARKPNKSAFSKDELSLMDDICAKYGKETAKKLSILSHMEPAWHYANYMDKLSPELIKYGREEDPEGL